MTIKDAYQLLFTEYPDVVGVDELCEMLQIGKTMAYSLLRQGKIKHFKQGNSYKIPKLYILSYMGIFDEKEVGFIA